MLTRSSVFALAFSTAAVAALASTDALAARGNFDGPWMVQITTLRGTCSSGVGFGVDIRNGVVSASAAASVQGRVSPNGATRVQVSAGNQSASGTGRLAGSSGSGSWKGVGSQGVCSGTWAATRR